MPLFGMSPASFPALLIPSPRPHRPRVGGGPDPRTVPPASHRQQPENDKDTGNECAPTRLLPASNFGGDKARWSCKIGWKGGVKDSPAAAGPRSI